MLARMSSPELSLIGLNELLTMDRWTLERRSRALAQPAFMGMQVMLARVLGRYKLYVPTTDIGFGAHVIMDGVWESWLTVFMASRIKPGMHVVDAGANHGYYTVLFADLVGEDGRVASFEPNPRTAQFLRQTVAVNGYDQRVSVFEIALVDQDGQTLSFLAPGAEPKNARVVPTALAEQPETITVTGARLDTLLADWPKIDFMKIDVEGAEETMLAGAWTLIERDRPELLLEFNATRCAHPHELLDRLSSVYGQRFAYVDHESRLAPVSRTELLDMDNLEDWLLFFSSR